MRLETDGLRIWHRMGMVSGATTAEEHKKKVSENMGVIGNRAAERSGSEAEQLCHPQRQTGHRSETGDEGEGKLG